MTGHPSSCSLSVPHNGIGHADFTSQGRVGRSGFARVENDFYPTTDPRAVAALAPHLPPACRFVEPCAGAGDLMRQLMALGHPCLDAFDIEPRAEGIRRMDALDWPGRVDPSFDVITNPPYVWPLLRQLIPHFIRRASGVWLLLQANFAHNQRAAPLLRHCHQIVSIGRLKWIPDSKHQDTKNFAWYLFARAQRTAGIEFHPRAVA